MGKKGSHRLLYQFFCAHTCVRMIEDCKALRARALSVFSFRNGTLDIKKKKEKKSRPSLSNAKEWAIPRSFLVLRSDDRAHHEDVVGWRPSKGVRGEEGESGDLTSECQQSCSFLFFFFCTAVFPCFLLSLPSFWITSVLFFFFLS